MINVRNIAITSLLLGLTILLIYSVLLISNGYLNLNSTFSLENASKIAPFIGSCVGVFFTLAGTLFVFENLRITSVNNERNQILMQKNQFESIFFNLLTQQRQIKDGIKSKVHFNAKEDGLDEKALEEMFFFDDLPMRITIDFDKKDKTKEELVKLYNYWFNIYNSDLGHYFRHLYHIVKFVDNNPYFNQINNNLSFMQKEDYIKILRAQLSNPELILLALNGMTIQGNNFFKFIEKYKLLVNINLEQDLTEDYQSRVPDAKIIADEYPQLTGFLK